jgi:hypothetical protein
LSGTSGNASPASAAFGQQLPAPIPEENKGAHRPQRGGQRDSRHAHPAHQNQIQHNVQRQIQRAAIKNQIRPPAAPPESGKRPGWTQRKESESRTSSAPASPAPYRAAQRPHAGRPCESANASRRSAPAQSASRPAPSAAPRCAACGGSRPILVRNHPRKMRDNGRRNRPASSVTTTLTKRLA